MVRQKVFFVATAGPSGTINLSPRGLDCFRILSKKKIAWVDYPGSGNETARHLEERSDITVMFCDLEGTDRIVRLFGTGRAVLPDSAEYPKLLQSMQLAPDTVIRQIFVVDIKLTQSSCGTGVPVYSYQSEGPLLDNWHKVEAAGKFKNTVERLHARPRPIEALKQKESPEDAQ